MKPGRILLNWILTVLTLAVFANKTSAQGVIQWTNFAGLAGGFGKTDGPSSEARFYAPKKVVIDSAGNIFVADTLNHAIRKITPEGVVSTYAGLAGVKGSSDGPAQSARFHSPYGLALHSSGDIYVADSGNHSVRKISAGGTVSTFAGSSGNGGNVNGTTGNARFNAPTDVIVTAEGVLFVTEPANRQVRAISEGQVGTFLSGNNFLGQQQGANFVFMHGSSGLALNAAEDQILIADTINHVIYRRAGTAALETIGVSGSQGSTDGNAVTARFNWPTGAAFSGSDAYVTDWGNHLIRKVTAAGVVTTVAGTAGNSGFADGTGEEARFKDLHKPAVDASGNLYVPDQHRIRKVTPGGIVTTVAGAVSNEGNSNGAGTTARFDRPLGIAVDAAGNIYVADSVNHIIRKISPVGMVTTLAGAPGLSGSADGTGTAARFASPNGLAVDSAGNVYVTDSFNHTIRRITPGGNVTTLAGLAGSAGAVNGTGSTARFSSPAGIAVDQAGNLYVADKVNHCIRKITSAGVVTTHAGGLGISGSANGVGTSARFLGPEAVAVDSGDNVYVADTGGSWIRKIAANRTVTTLAGEFMSMGYADGSSSNARFFNPCSVAVTANGDVYVTDTGNHTIRKITQAGTVSTIGGTAEVYGHQDGLGSLAGFAMPAGIAVHGDGNIYVADTGNNRIVLGRDPGAPSFVSGPSAQLVAAGQTVIFSAEMSGTPAPQLQWLKNGLVLEEKTDNPLEIVNVGLSNAGDYSLKATNSAGSETSPAAALGVVDPSDSEVAVIEGNDLTLTLASAGPGLNYLWECNGADLSSSDDPRFKGATTHQLTVENFQAADAGTYTCIVQMGDLSITSGDFIVTGIASPVIIDLESGVWSVNRSAGGSKVVLQSGLTLSKVSGLPPGVKLNLDTGEFTGRPTKAKIVKKVVVPYTVTITVTNDAGTSEPYTFEWLVEPLPGTVLGSFYGTVERDENLNGRANLDHGFGGFLQAKVASSGAVSGSIKMAGVKLAFRGPMEPQADGSLVLTTKVKRKKPLDPLDLSLVIANDGSLSGAVSDGTATAGLSGWKVHANPEGAGSYNVALDPGTSSATRPNGSGFAVLKVSAKGTATIKGKLADGAALTGSSAVAANGKFPWHQMLYKNTGSVQGVLTFGASSITGSADWNKAAQTKTSPNYTDGFGLHALAVSGGRYVKPAKGEAALGLPSSLLLRLTDGGLESPYLWLPVTRTDKNTLVPGEDSLGLKIKLASATGLITGTYMLVAEEGSKPLKMVVAGALIPGQAAGMGYFLLATSSTKGAPVLSGQIVLDSE